MSDDGPLGGGDPFGAMPFFGDLFRMMSSAPSSAWESARQLAVTVATEGTSEPNVEPATRIALEQLGRSYGRASFDELSMTRDEKEIAVINGLSAFATGD